MASARRKIKLTAHQKDMYAQEKLMNFRWVSKIIAHRSSHVLTSDDLVSLEIHQELSDLGQFTEIASSRGLLPIKFLFDNISTLLRKDFPLEGYDALPDAQLVSEFYGSVAKLHGYVAYRPPRKQLVLAFSGTTNLTQAMFDVRTNMHFVSSGHGAAHAGFWGIYKGIRGAAHQGIREAFENYGKEGIEEVVVTGHSLGGAISYLFMMDLLSRKDSAVPVGTKLKFAAFGSPRPGNAQLARHWQSLVKDYREKHGEGSFTEYSVKAYNDGVQSLPPLSFGFRHFTPHPLYCHNGLMYQIPEEFHEDSLFLVKEDDLPETKNGISLPKGGHNYYNGRDMERVSRRIQWLDKVMAGTENWEERFLQRVENHRTRKTFSRRASMLLS